jgi:hypothetical protein
MKQTGNLKAVMLTMGHKDVKTAMRYQHPEVEVVRQALNQLIRTEEAAGSAPKLVYGTPDGTQQNVNPGKSLNRKP